MLQMKLGSCVAVAVAATAPIQPLAWERTYAMGVALKSKKKKKVKLGPQTSQSRDKLSML